MARSGPLTFGWIDKKLILGCGRSRISTDRCPEFQQVEAPDLSSGRARFEAEKPVFTHEGGAGFMGSGNGLSMKGLYPHLKELGLQGNG